MIQKIKLFLFSIVAMFMIPSVYARDSIFQMFTNLFDGMPSPVIGKVILFFLVFFVFWLIANMIHKGEGRERSIVAIIALLLAFISTIAIPNEIVTTIMQEYSFIVSFILMLLPIAIVIGLFVLMHIIHKAMGHSRATAIAGLFISLLGLIITTMVSNSLSGLTAIQNIEMLGWAVSIIDVIIIFLILYIGYFAIQIFSGPRDPDSPMLKPVGESPIAKGIGNMWKKTMGQEARAERRLNKLVNQEHKQTLDALQNEVKELEDLAKLKRDLAILHVNLNPNNREFWSRLSTIDTFRRFVNVIESDSERLLTDLKTLETKIDQKFKTLEAEYKRKNLNYTKMQIGRLKGLATKAAGENKLTVDEKNKIHAYLEKLHLELNKEGNDDLGIVKRINKLETLSLEIMETLTKEIINHLNPTFKKIVLVLRAAQSHAGNYDVLKQEIRIITTDVEKLKEVEQKISNEFMLKIDERKRETQILEEHIKHEKNDILHIMEDMNKLQANKDRILHIVNNH
jgi:hypothetical protein